MVGRKINGTSVLVTGSAGFIGSHLCEELVATHKCTVVGIDNLFLGRLDNLEGIRDCEDFVQIIGDARNQDLIRTTCKAHKVDIVFHLATQPINHSFVSPNECADVSISSMLGLLEAQRCGYFGKLVNFSTSEVYGDLHERKCFDNPDLLRPLSVYAAGKASADLLLRSYVNTFNNDAYIVRPFNNYGPRQAWKPDLAGLIPNTIVRILSGKKPIIRGTGEQIREFVFVRDCVQEAIQSVDIYEPNQIITVGSSTRRSVKEVVRKICRLMNYEGSVVYEKARIADAMTHRSATSDSDQGCNTSGTAFEDGLMETIEYYKTVS